MKEFEVGKFDIDEVLDKIESSKLYTSKDANDSSEEYITTNEINYNITIMNNKDIKLLFGGTSIRKGIIYQYFCGETIMDYRGICNIHIKILTVIDTHNHKMNIIYQYKL